MPFLHNACHSMHIRQTAAGTRRIHAAIPSKDSVYKGDNCTRSRSTVIFDYCGSLTQWKSYFCVRSLAWTHSQRMCGELESDLFSEQKFGVNITAHRIVGVQHSHHQSVGKTFREAWKLEYSQQLCMLATRKGLICNCESRVCCDSSGRFGVRLADRESSFKSKRIGTMGTPLEGNLRSELVVVASKNNVKIEASKQAFKRAFPEQKFKFEMVNAVSGVAEQPLSDEETLKGARNRAKQAMHEVELADYVVAIEGGVEWSRLEAEPQLMAFAWVVVLSQDFEGKARTAAFMLPPPIAELIAGGMQLGEADDKVFGRSNGKQQNGTVGMLTRDELNRQTYYEHAITLALIPFINPDLYRSPSVPIIPAGSLSM